MKITLKTTELISYLLACALGTLFHFVYEWSGSNPFLGLFFPVNESVWEHLKLLFYPIMAVSAAEYCILEKKYFNFLCTKFFSALLGMVLTIVLFYTYSGVYGKNVDAVNILIYFLSMGISYIYSFHMLSSRKLYSVPPFVCWSGICAMILLFAVFTIYPPGIGLFLSP